MSNEANLKNWLVTLMFLLVVIGFFGLPAQAALYSGSGTQEDPYDINTPAKMDDIGNNSGHWASYFILTDNIDMTGYSYTVALIAPDTSGSGGHQGIKFTGVFDGNGFEIRDLYIDNGSTGQQYLGLFGYVSGTVKNLGLINATVIGPGAGDIIGILAGYNDGTISNCSASGSNLDGDNDVGGLVGINNDTIENCCAIISNINGFHRIGGLVGNNLGNCNGSYASDTTLSGTNYIGGFVGNNDGTIEDCYAHNATMTGTHCCIGGFAGGNVNGTIRRSYAAGCEPNDTTLFAGGFAGDPGARTFTACFWENSATPGFTADVGIPAVEEPDSKIDLITIGQMQTKSTFTGWDFWPDGAENIWINSNDYTYPLHTWRIDNFEGDGTQGDPYQIDSGIDLITLTEFPYLWDKHFILMADVNLSGYTDFSFQPIGIGTYHFTGKFEGNGHAIKSYSCYQPSNSYVGLFGYIDDPNAEIKNLTLVDPNVSGSNHVGSFVGTLANGTITECRMQGGSVSGSYAGGLVGSNYSTINNCFATGYVSGNNYIGGLAGYNYGTVSNCYSIGVISGGHRGGLVGYNYYGDIFASFWDTQTSGESDGVGLIEGDGTIEVYGRPTVQMKTQETFTAVGWDFVSESVNGTDNYWRMCVDGIDYPELALQSITADLACPAGVDFGDFGFFASRWLEIDCDSKNDCGRADMDLSTDIGLPDLQIICDNWLVGK